MREPKPPHRAALTALFALLVFIVLIITMFVVGGIVYLLVRLGVLGEAVTPNMTLPLIIFAVVSIVLGTLIAAIISKRPLRPVNELISGMNSLASGNYDTKLEIGNHPVGRDVAQSFNLLADELKNTEMLRSDFINNFSHEFKTPIVSIRGFAKLMQKGNLPEKQQQEYLSIIVDEASRLSDLATNVLNLTKVENQSILTDITTFNLSEQIRDCVLLLEKKWVKKSLSIVADFGEYDINANEELLMQVWINLLDNSIKFSYLGGEINISITREREALTVAIKNYGPEISEEEKTRIFNRFWQGDSSHASEGTGIGLSIAKRIVELHKGSIDASSTPHETVFCVTLPQ